MLLSPELIFAVIAIVAVVGFALYSTRSEGRKRDAAAPASAHRPDQAGPPVPVAAVAGSGAAGAPAAEPGTTELPPSGLLEASKLGGPTITFADVAGLEDAIAELREVKEYLADPQRFRRLGAELPRGILLCGHPGNGKTLLARALAGEAGVPFYFVSAASFIEQYVGLGAARIRQIFDEVRAGPLPAIVFLDELDAVGGKRTGGPSGDREFDHTLNQLLVELDGFAASSGVLILGATNREELLDPALIRPGRFDRRLHIERPDLPGREAILRLHASDRPFSRHVDWYEVASHTTGLSGAELAGVVNDACLLAARRHRERIGPEEIEEAVARAGSGNRSSRVLDEPEKRLIAIHEAGHALLSLLLKHVEIPPRVSIVTRGGSGTASVWSLSRDREILTKRELMAQLIVLQGGRAAEMNTFGEPSTRAEDDLDDAAKLARQMIERWAMTGRFELAGRNDDAVTRSRTENRSEPAVAKMLARSEQAARTILGDNRARLRAIAEELLERETLSITDVARAAGLPHPYRAEGDEGERDAPVASVSRIFG